MKQHDSHHLEMRFNLPRRLWLRRARVRRSVGVGEKRCGRWGLDGADSLQGRHPRLAKLGATFTRPRPYLHLPCTHHHVCHSSFLIDLLLPDHVRLSQGHLLINWMTILSRPQTYFHHSMCLFSLLGDNSHRSAVSESFSRYGCQRLMT